MSSLKHTRDDRIRDFDFELEQLLLQLVLRDHPEWEAAFGAPLPAWLEVQRLRADVDGLELLKN